jgi:hypothetical protein
LKEKQLKTAAIFVRVDPEAKKRLQEAANADGIPELSVWLRRLGWERANKLLGKNDQK